MGENIKLNIVIVSVNTTTYIFYTESIAQYRDIASKNISTAPDSILATCWLDGIGRHATLRKLWPIAVPVQVR